MKRGLLGIDVGTGSTKAIIIDPDRRGSVLGFGASPYLLHTPNPGWAEQHAEDWWQAVISAVRQALAQSALIAEDIVGVGLTGQMQGAVLLDSAHNVVRPPLIWCDQRTAAIAEQMTQRIGESRILTITGNAFLVGSTAGKVVWIRENEPDVYARVTQLLLPKDYIRLRLTGDCATDTTDASATALFDIRARTWSADMIKALNIPSAWLPPIYESSAVTGQLTASAAALLGLAPGTAVVAGAGDNAACAVGCGAIEPGTVVSSIGTGAVLLAMTGTPLVDRAGRLDLFCNAIPGSWQIIGATNSAGGALRWLRDTCGEAERAMAVQPGADVYDLLCRQAESVPPGSEGLLCLPYLTGMRTPYPDAQATGAFWGITLRHNRSFFIRAVLEGVAFCTRNSVEVFRSLGIPVKQIRFIGGGAKSSLWRQIQADVTGIDHLTVNVQECAAFGSALLAGVGAGCYRDLVEACRSMVRVEQISRPMAGNGPIYERNYAQFLRMLEATHQFTQKSF